MASFTDQTNIQYTPYIETNPTDAYLRVGMYKEQQLAAGIQKVQQTVDTLTGLPIIKDEDKKYLQDKLSSLKGGITKNLSGDFSDSRIVNQIAGAAKQIYSDPVVQNSVQGTMSYQKGLSDIEEAKKKGTWNVANETVFQDGVNSWLSDKTVGSKASQYFTGYTPYTDVNEMFIKYWKETNPTDRTDIADYFYIDQNGNRQISKTFFKGKSPEQVQSVWNLVKGNANVQQQINIDGKYQFRGVSPEQMYGQIGERTKSSIDRNNAAILTLQAKAATGDLEAASKIEQLKSYNLNAEKSLSSYAELLQKNPEAAKSEIISANRLDSLIGAYTSQTMEKNPLWETTLEEDRFLLQAKQWQATFDQSERKFDFDKYKFSVEQTTKKLKEEKDAAGNNLILVPKPVEEQDVKDETTARQDVITHQDAYTQSVRKTLATTWSDPSLPAPYVYDVNTQRYEPNVGSEGYPDKLAADSQAQIKWGALRNEDLAGKIDPNSKMAQLLAESSQNYVNLSASKKKIEKIENKYIAQTNALVNIVKDIIPDKTRAEELSKAFIVDEKLQGADAAKALLVQKYGENWRRGMGIEQPTMAPSKSTPEFEARFKNLGAYQEMAKRLKQNPALTSYVMAKDLDYKKMQTVDVGWRMTENVEGKDMKLTNNSFRSMVETAKSLNPSSTKGDINKFLEIADPANKNFDGNLYTSTIDAKNNTATLYVSNAKDGSVEMTVPLSVYNNVFPGRVPISQFRQKFQSQIELSGGRTTDWQQPQGGFATAFEATPSSKAPLIVKYHVDVEGNNNYILRWYVKDRASGQMLKGGEPVNGVQGVPLNMSEAEIMAAINLIKDPKWVEGVILHNQK